MAALRPEKNHELFLRAAADRPAAHPEATFLIVGDGPERPKLEAMAAELGIAAAVRFLGTRSDIPRLLAAMDVFVLTSRIEANPVSILEAMATGLPVVAPQRRLDRRIGGRRHDGLFDRARQRRTNGQADLRSAGECRAGTLAWVAPANRSSSIAGRSMSWSRGYEQLISRIYSAKCGQSRPGLPIDTANPGPHAAVESA